MLITTYLTGDKRQLIADAFEAEDWNNYETYVHGLKITSLNIGAEELSEHAKAPEYAVKDTDYEYIRVHHKAVLDEYSIMLEQLRTAL